MTRNKVDLGPLGKLVLFVRLLSCKRGGASWSLFLHPDADYAAAEPSGEEQNRPRDSGATFAQLTYLESDQESRAHFQCCQWQTRNKGSQNAYIPALCPATPSSCYELRLDPNDNTYYTDLCHDDSCLSLHVSFSASTSTSRTSEDQLIGTERERYPQDHKCHQLPQSCIDYRLCWTKLQSTLKNNSNISVGIVQHEVMVMAIYKHVWNESRSILGLPVINNPLASTLGLASERPSTPIAHPKSSLRVSEECLTFIYIYRSKGWSKMSSVKGCRVCEMAMQVV